MNVWDKICFNENKFKILNENMKTELYVEKKKKGKWEIYDKGLY